MDFLGHPILVLKKKTRLENIKFSNMGRNEISQNTIQKRFLNFNYNEGFAYGVYRKQDFINIFKIVKKFSVIQ